MFSSTWIWESEDTSMIWEIPAGTEIPEELRLLEQDSDYEGAYVLQPKDPMPLQGKSLQTKSLLP
ncbi:MAG: hypothetical protein Q9184_007294 [Pyrenodesmia sp. 2 TL-2023]